MEVAEHPQHQRHPAQRPLCGELHQRHLLRGRRRILLQRHERPDADRLVELHPVEAGAKPEPLGHIRPEHGPDAMSLSAPGATPMPAGRAGDRPGCQPLSTHRATVPGPLT